MTFRFLIKPQKLFIFLFLCIDFPGFFFLNCIELSHAQSIVMLEHAHFLRIGNIMCNMDGGRF